MTTLPVSRLEPGRGTFGGLNACSGSGGAVPVFRGVSNARRSSLLPYRGAACESGREAMRRLSLALGAVLILAASACSSGHRRPDAPPTSSTQAATPNPDVIPAVITPAYVDAVFGVLEHVDGNASRALITGHGVTPTALADIRSIYNDPLYAQEVEIAHESISASLGNVRNPPGDVRVSVVALVSISSNCIFVRTASDYGAVLVNPGPPVASEYWVLRPKQSGHDPRNLNPTPWALSFNADFTSPTTIPDQCEL
jgi:hypothetical protein